MARSLVVVESPAKAKTINKFLGKGYLVKACMGHVRDLPEKELGIDIVNDFRPKYVIIKGKGKVLNELRKTAEEMERILLATDPDREGEAIAWHVAHEIAKNDENVYRILFNEITENAVRKAIKKPLGLDLRKVNAQQARRILDRLVGYKVSPFLWRTVYGGLSAGRVQSVALRLVCERDREISKFKPREYWSITANLKGKKTSPFRAELIKSAGRKVDIPHEKEAQRIVSELKGCIFRVFEIKRKEQKRYPSPPFITSTLQQDAYRRLGFGAKKTMVVAQQLYEGVELEGGAVGLITYMRTDSVRIASEAISDAREYIASSYGVEYVPNRPRTYKSKKGAQEAHEAIRPTLVSRDPKTVKKFLTSDQARLYELIWNRFIASQMKPAVLDVTTVDITADNYLFRASGSVMKFRGFTILYTEARDDEETKEGGRVPDNLREREELILISLDPEQHFTKPPPHYTEATLVKELESQGIGRPSTYSQILSTIQERDYVRKEKGKLIATELGTTVNALLVGAFPDIFDVKFTAKMEDDLDRIEAGQDDWVKVLEDFYGSFEKALSSVREKQAELKESLQEKTDVICEKCGRRMVVKWGRNGKFMACSGYPECKNTRPLEDELEGLPEIDEKCDKCGADMVVKMGRYGRFLACSNYPKCKNTKPLKDGSEATDEKCEKCGGDMVVKEGRYGRFLACSNYPKCKNTKSMTLGIACPRKGCDGELVERRTKSGRVFYGCNRYPDCKFASWDKPVAQKCPECGAPFLVEKATESRGDFLKCIKCKGEFPVS